MKNSPRERPRAPRPIAPADRPSIYRFAVGTRTDGARTAQCKRNPGKRQALSNHSNGYHQGG